MTRIYLSISRFISRHIHFACFSFLAVQALMAEAVAEETSPDVKETLFLKRISEYWNEKDYPNVKRQIFSFLEKYQHSSAQDPLNAMLGDLYFQEKRYDEALKSYLKIQKEELQRKTLVNRLHCLFEMGRYDEIVDQATSARAQVASQDTDPLRLLLAEALLKKTASAANEAEKEKWALEAEQHYQALLSSPYEEHALLPLAEIARLLNRYPEASALYVKLAGRHPSRADEFLFHAATMQVQYDKKRAADTFGEIYPLGGQNASSAAYNQLALLFQEKRFDELVHCAQTSLGSISDDKLPLVHFYIGWSHYSLEQYREAAPFLGQFISAVPTNTQHQKNALLSLIVCAFKTQNLALFDEALASFDAHYPKATEHPKALLMHAELCGQLKELTALEADFEKLLSDYPSFEMREEVFYSYAKLMAENGQWLKARHLFSTFLEQFSSSERLANAARQFLSSSIQAFRAEQMDKSAFVGDLIRALDHPGAFTVDEKQKYHFSLVKALFELQKTEELQIFGAQFLSFAQDKQLCLDVHLMLAEAHENSPEQAISHLKEALAFEPSSQTCCWLHLKLYNLFLAQDRVGEAAEHLFASFSLGTTSLKQANLLWLANYYYSHPTQNPQALERSALIFERVLSLGTIPFTLNISTESLFLEAEVLKLAEIYHKQNLLEKEVKLLEALTKMQEGNPAYAWKLRKQALFQIGKAYEASNDVELALKTYDYLVHSSSYPSAVSDAALLQWCRLQYSQWQRDQKQVSEAEVVTLLDALKDLQIQKRLSSEPIHLEAALEYAHLRLSQVDEKERAEKALLFLSRIQEEFSGTADLISQEYQEARAHDGAKDLLVCTYLKYVEAESCYYRAQIEKEQGHIEESTILQAQSLSLLDELMQNAQNLTPFLCKRIENCREALKNTL